MVAYLIGAPFKLNREQVSLLEVDRFASKYAILFMLMHWTAIYQVIAITIHDRNPLASIRKAFSTSWYADLPLMYHGHIQKRPFQPKLRGPVDSNHC